MQAGNIFEAVAGLQGLGAQACPVIVATIVGLMLTFQVYLHYYKSF
jgi:hypothetical protein